MNYETIKSKNPGYYKLSIDTISILLEVGPRSVIVNCYKDNDILSSNFFGGAFTMSYFPINPSVNKIVVKTIDKVVEDTYYINNYIDDISKPSTHQTVRVLKSLKKKTKFNFIKK